MISRALAEELLERHFEYKAFSPKLAADLCQTIITFYNRQAELQKLVDRWQAGSFGNIKKPYDACQYAEKMAMRDCAEQLARIIGSPDRITE